ncbi:phosphatase PAP2 family protein [Deltaproteobacteria bacterium OttesenSCG-928-K17]|nr:phosphatase PAP2 family protein [Deltaproteobacteria bacterium OttesenSCG-928-K17]
MPDFKLRPNYYLFNGSILIYAAGLLLQVAWAAAALSLAAAAAIHLATPRTPRRGDAPPQIGGGLSAPAAPRLQAGRLEVLAYLIIFTLFFFGTTVTIPLIRPDLKYDELLRAIDARYFFDIGAWVRSVSRPWLTDLITFCYLLYGPLLYSSIIYFGFFRKEVSLAYFAGLYSVFGLGFIGYLTVPAEGPHFARLAEVMPLIASGPFHTFADPLIKGGCTRSDAFPSLHIAVSWYTLIFMYFNTRRLFWLWLLPVAGLSVATVYLFYHYQIDLLAGFVVAVISLALAKMTAAAVRRRGDALSGDKPANFRP